MKTFAVAIALVLSACASHPPEMPYSTTKCDTTARRADIEGFKVVSFHGTRTFCGSEARLGSHIIAPCMTEADWRARQFWISPPDCYASTAPSPYVKSQ